MGTHALEGGAGVPTRTATQTRRRLRWLAGGFALAFLVPFVFTDVQELPRDLYYAVYIVAVAGYFGLWVRATGQSLASETPLRGARLHRSPLAGRAEAEATLSFARVG